MLLYLLNVPYCAKNFDSANYRWLVKGPEQSRHQFGTKMLKNKLIVNIYPGNKQPLVTDYDYAKKCNCICWLSYSRLLLIIN